MKRVHYLAMIMCAMVMYYFTVPCAVGINGKPVPLNNVQREHNEATVITPEQSLTLLQTILKNMEAEYDPEFGGFGSPSSPKGTKLYNPSALDFLHIHYDRTGDASSLDMVQKTLSAMARGGVYDQLGGGFHYYSMDGKWRVPHFEKKSHENAELLQVYLHAYQATGREEFVTIARGIISYTMRELADQEHGGFYNSQGTESSPDDDADYYTRTRAEVRAVLPSEQARIVEAYYDIRARGEMKHNPAKNVLFVATSPEKIAQRHKLSAHAVGQTLDRAKEKLLSVRRERPAPRVDTSIIIASNGMCISAFLEASSVLGDATLREFALKSLDRLIRDAYRKGQGMPHTVSNGAPHADATLDDQVFFVQACIDAYQVTGEKRYLAIARELMDFSLEKFCVPSVESFSLYQRDLATTRQLGWPGFCFHDFHRPCPNFMAALVVERLALLTTEKRYHTKAERIIRACTTHVSPNGPGASLGSYATTLAMLLHPPPKLVIIGKKQDPRTQTLWQKALATYRPGKVVVVYDPTTDKDLLFPPAKDGSPLVYVCSGDVCYPPVRTVEQMVKLIQTAGRD